VEDSTKKDSTDLIERLRKGSLGPAAVAGAFASFISAARGSGPNPAEKGKPGFRLVPIGASETKSGPAPILHDLPLHYAHRGTLETVFHTNLAGIAVGPGDKIFVLGDGEIRVFESSGKPVRSFKAPANASCIAVGPDGRICIGASERVHVVDKSGIAQHSFAAGANGQAAKITSVKLLPKEILVADAQSRCIVRFDYDGKRLGDIGTRNKTHGFILPNKSLDMDVDATGTIIATDTGRHRVSLWKLDGAAVRDFGKFGLRNPEDFVGCCNPVNLAFAPEGRIVTAEKVAARVKVFDSEGKLLGLIGRENFDPKCTQFHLAVDSHGRILVADPVRLEVKIFSAASKTGDREIV
jgi:hypothetical protein